MNIKINIIIKRKCELSLKYKKKNMNTRNIVKDKFKKTTEQFDL